MLSATNEPLNSDTSVAVFFKNISPPVLPFSVMLDITVLFMWNFVFPAVIVGEEVVEKYFEVIWKVSVPGLSAYTVVEVPAKSDILNTGFASSRVAL